MNTRSNTKRKVELKKSSPKIKMNTRSNTKRKAGLKKSSPKIKMNTRSNTKRKAEFKKPFPKQITIPKKHKIVPVEQSIETQFCNTNKIPVLDNSQMQRAQQIQLIPPQIQLIPSQIHITTDFEKISPLSNYQSDEVIGWLDNGIPEDLNILDELLKGSEEKLNQQRYFSNFFDRINEHIHSYTSVQFADHILKSN